MGKFKKVTGSGSLVKPGDFVIDDRTDNDKIYAPVINGEVKAHGLVPRDYSKYPAEMFAPPADMPIIPRSEWDARINEQEERQSSLEHYRNAGLNGRPVPSLDQDGQGYCWAYSTTACVMLARMVANQPYVRLSAHAIGCKVKGFRDEGGWCGLSAKFHREVGCPSVEFWKEKSMARSNDRAETWANAAKHKVTEDWVDLTRAVHSQNLAVEQIASCLLTNNPCALDYDEMAHSMCGFRWTRVEAGVYAPKVWNSWTDGWGNNGTGIINRRWTVDGAVCLRVTGGSPN